jgi:sigma-E factor negative regulatory protein RseC
MLQEPAIVLETFEESAAAWMLVEVRRNTGCGHCASKSGCGTGVLSQWWDRSTLRLKLPNPNGLRRGDQITLELPESALLQASLWVYILPLLSLLATALAYESLAASLGWPRREGLTALAGAAGLAGGLLAARWWFKRQPAPRFQPTVKP